MVIQTNRLVICGVLFTLTLVSGLALSAVGKPLNGALFNVHKLIALAAVVYTAIEINRILRLVGVPTTWVALIAAAVLFALVLFVSGGLMSAGKFNYATLLLFHRIAPVGLVGSLGGMAYLLLGRLG